MRDNPPEETIEHMIFSCPFSIQCWNRLGIIWNATGNMLDLVQQGKDFWDRPMFMEVFIVAAWSIWKERNNLLFNNVIPNIDSWMVRFKTDFELLRHRAKEKLHPFISSFLASL
jgi:hypothetical protein